MQSMLESRVLAAAIRLFAGQGYDRTTIRQIAATAKVSSAAIQRLFGSKAGLFEEALRSAVVNVIDPQNFLADIAAAVEPDNVLSFTSVGAGCLNPLVQHSAALVTNALSSPNKHWKRIALAAIRILPFEEEKDHPAGHPSTRLRVIEFTDYRRGPAKKSGGTS